MVVFESTVNVFSPWNQMADALSMAASIFAVIAFGCSSVPAVLSFPQAARVVTVTSVNAAAPAGASQSQSSKIFTIYTIDPNFINGDIIYFAKSFQK